MDTDATERSSNAIGSENFGSEGVDIALMMMARLR